MPTQRSARRGWPLLAWAALGALAAGCSSKGPYPVRGKLVYADNDQPVKELEGQDIIFDLEKGGLSARGTIRKDGTFELTSKKDGDGAFPGEYVVTLTQPYRKPERPYVGDRVVDITYEDPAATDLRAIVKPEPNDFTFKLRRIKSRAK
jgi:hypothetical protein